MTEVAVENGLDDQFRQEIHDLIGSNPLFERFTPTHIDQLVSIAGDPVIVAADDVVMREGDFPPDNVYVIQKGTVEILKNEPDSDVQYRIATLGPGNTIGEVALLDDGPRSATVRALEELSLLVIPIDKLSAMANAEESIDSRMKINLAYELGHRLRNTNEATVRNLREKLAEAETRAEMGKFVSKVLIGTCLYMFALGLTTALAQTGRHHADIRADPVGLRVWSFPDHQVQRLPVQRLRHHDEELAIRVKDSLLWTLPLLAIIVGFKVIMVYSVPAFAITILSSISIDPRTQHLAWRFSRPSCMPPSSRSKRASPVAACRALSKCF